jgi:hypothetical protein
MKLLSLLRETSSGQTLHYLWQARIGRERERKGSKGEEKKGEGMRKALSMKLHHCERRSGQRSFIPLLNTSKDKILDLQYRY